MPHLHFHYYTAEGIETDDIGCSFESLELAYVDAFHSMVEIGAELLKRQVNPAAHRIEIADGDGNVLMELRFDDIFRKRQLEPAILTQVIGRRLQDARRLRREIDGMCATAREAVASAHATLRRARAIRSD